jgi:hypothetical protein
MTPATELDRERLAQVAAEAIAKLQNSNAADSKRWINAIARAVAEIENNPFMTYDLDSHSLLILSTESGQIYTANGTCECKAFEFGKPCHHRAAARLIQRYLEVTQ